MTSKAKHEKAHQENVLHFQSEKIYSSLMAVCGRKKPIPHEQTCGVTRHAQVVDLNDGIAVNS